MQPPAVAKPRIRVGQRAHIFNIESSSRPNHFHTVDTLHLVCSCEAGRRGRRCHHLADVLMYEAWRKRELARAAVGQAAVVETHARPRGIGSLQEAFA